MTYYGKPRKIDGNLSLDKDYHDFLYGRALRYADELGVFDESIKKMAPMNTEMLEEYVIKLEADYNKLIHS